MTNSCKFQQLYHSLQRDNISRDLLAAVYHPDVVFTDPFHQIHGLDDLTHYFAQLYSNVQSIDFVFHHSVQAGDINFQRWSMTFSHPAIARGKAITLAGCSELIWQQDRIIKHTDFFDAGAMLYEHLPVLSWAIRKLKARMQ